MLLYIVCKKNEEEEADSTPPPPTQGCSSGPQKIYAVQEKAQDKWASK